MIESTFAEQFAKEWIDVWNSHELADGTIKTVRLLRVIRVESST